MARNYLVTDYLTGDGTLLPAADVADELATESALSPLAAWPIGSIFLSAVSTNPNTLLGGGTWSAIAAGRVLIGIDAGDPSFDVGGETGGAKAVAAAGSVAAPTFSGSALGTHAHGAGTLAPSAHAGATVGNHAFTQPGAHSNHAVTQPANHVVTQPGAHSNHVVTQPANHVFTQPGNHTSVATKQGTAAGNVITVGTHSGGAVDAHSASAVDAHSAHSGAAVDAHSATAVDAHSAHSGGAVDAHSVGQASAHTMSGTGEAVSAGTPAGTNSAPAFTGAATSVVQPYLVCYMWQRTA